MNDFRRMAMSKLHNIELRHQLAPETEYNENAGQNRLGRIIFTFSNWQNSRNRRWNYRGWNLI